MDFIEPILPPYSAVHMFILNAIDYFMKWVEEVSLKNDMK
jgi:hypothetical protein